MEAVLPLGSSYLVLTERELLQQVLITATHLRRQGDRQMNLRAVLPLVLLDTDRQADRCTFRMYWPWYSWTQTDRQVYLQEVLALVLLDTEAELLR